MTPPLQSVHSARRDGAGGLVRDVLRRWRAPRDVAPARTPAPHDASRLEIGRNCWRVERAERASCIQDAADYFRLVREAILRARKSIFILGWDISADVDLLPGVEDAGAPTKLGPLLDHVVRECEDLHCYVLTWDYAQLYAFERDPFTRLKLGWNTHRRVRFRYDDEHPLGGSHHQKVVVVDDRLAFSGGIDLTGHRWDTPEHRVDDPLRVNVRGKPYEPFHDLQMVVEGPAATALGELARARWRRVGKRRLPPVARWSADASSSGSPWPASLAADWTDVDVAISRTEPRFRTARAVRECEAWFLDSIAAAKRTIYVENQYFTSVALGEALAKRLREPDGPELIVVGPRQCSGWLEQKTMGALRHEVLLRLVDADRHGRLRLLYAAASREREVCTFIHSKLLAIDDESLRVGSANLSNRSLGVDTECDLTVVAAGEERVRRSIARVRDRLVAEHLGVAAERVTAAVERTGSLRAAIDELAVLDHTLVRVEVDRSQPPETSDALRQAADPYEPMEVTRSLDRLLPDIEATDERSGYLALALPWIALAVGVVSLGWASDLGYWTSLHGLRELLATAATPRGLLWTLAAFLIGGLAFLPLELLALATAVAFGTMLGGALAFAGAIGAAAIGWAVGRWLGPARIGRVVGARAYRLLRELERRGGMSVALLRLMPVSSATSVHLLCGAARVRWRDYAVGTALGSLPGIVALAVLGGLLRRVILEPSAWTASGTAALALILAAIVLRVRKRLFLSHAQAAAQEQLQRSRYG